MKLLIKTTPEKKMKVEEKLKKDDKVSRASITVKDGSVYGKEKTYYFLIEGDEETLSKAKELVKENAEEVTGEEKDEIISKIKEEEENALAGFGAILG